LTTRTRGVRASKNLQGLLIAAASFFDGRKIRIAISQGGPEIAEALPEDLLNGLMQGADFRIG
jgi:hypothetical protein